MVLENCYKLKTTQKLYPWSNDKKDFVFGQKLSLSTTYLIPILKVFLYTQKATWAVVARKINKMFRQVNITCNTDPQRYESGQATSKEGSMCVKIPFATKHLSCNNPA